MTVLLFQNVFSWLCTRDGGTRIVFHVIILLLAFWGQGLSVYPQASAEKGANPYQSTRSNILEAPKFFDKVFNFVLLEITLRYSRKLVLFPLGSKIFLYCLIYTIFFLFSKISWMPWIFAPGSMKNNTVFLVLSYVYCWSIFLYFTLFSSFLYKYIT